MLKFGNKAIMKPSHQPALDASKTGEITEEMVQAAQQFLAALTPEQRSQAVIHSTTPSASTGIMCRASAGVCHSRR
jgi:uncharacterized protein YbbK (DUF523 family)